MPLSSIYIETLSLRHLEYDDSSPQQSDPRLANRFLYLASSYSRRTEYVARQQSFPCPLLTQSSRSRVRSFLSAWDRLRHWSSSRFVCDARFAPLASPPTLSDFSIGSPAEVASLVSPTVCFECVNSRLRWQMMNHYMISMSPSRISFAISFNSRSVYDDGSFNSNRSTYLSCHSLAMMADTLFPCA